MSDLAADRSNAPEEEPRSALVLIWATLDLYRRFPLLFFALAAGVVVPYEVIILAATGAGPFARGSLGFGVSTLLSLIDLVLIDPLVSALHVQAVAELRADRRPRLAPIARQGLLALPVVLSATAISGLGISLGLLALAVPGLFLMIRWAVVAQIAAIDQQGWLPALRRSAQLTKGNYGHVFALIFGSGLIAAVPAVLIGLAFGHDSTTVASFAVGTVVQIVTYSFSALVTALLFYDLLARHESVLTPALVPPAGQAEGYTGTRPAPGPHSIDPRKYSDHDRPAGWYINPEMPSRMQYWGAGDPPGWGSTTRTPRKVRRDWEDKDGG